MKILCLICFLVFSISYICFAQSNYTESLTITTYYPSPYGVYRNLKLNPTDQVPSGAALSEGVMYYNRSDHMIKYRNNTGWVNLTGGGSAGGGGNETFWVSYRGNNIVNNNTGNVGIGLDASSEATQPQSLLTVMKQYNPAAGSGFHRVVSFGQHNIDTGRQSYLSFYFQPENDGTYAAESVNIFAPGSIGQPCYSKHILFTTQDPDGTIRFSLGGRSSTAQEVMRLVNTTSGRFVGIGTTNPGAKLEVAGQVKITGGSPGAGKVLTSDANGLASWQPAGGGGGLSCVRRTITSTTTAIALCPAGYYVTGGGCALNGGCQLDRGESYPEPGQEGWHCYNGYCAPFFPLTAYAICCK